MPPPDALGSNLSLLLPASGGLWASFVSVPISAFTLTWLLSSEAKRVSPFLIRPSGFAFWAHRDPG